MHVPFRFALALVMMMTAWLAAAPIDFTHQIQPILKEHCAQCHTADKRKGGFSMNTRGAVLEGGENGPGAVAGDPDRSLLIKLITSDDPDERMPLDKDPLSDAEVALLKEWVKQDLPWQAGFSFAIKYRKAPLAPRRPELPPPPAHDDVTHPIDRLLAPYFAEHDFTPGKIVADRDYVRRVYLDLIGLLPTPQQLEAFEQDSDPDKRRKLVRQLLDDRRNYAEHWITFWNDALRNAYRGAGFIDSGRKQITTWLYLSLYDNKPYDQFVRELINPALAPGSEGFIKGIVWRGVVNASQRPEMQAAQNISQVFLGINLKCASCHDSFVNDWKLEQAYAFASVFAESPLEINRCDKPTGEMSQIGFLYPELGSIDSAAPRDERIAQLANIVTSEGNGRLSRTIVNRLWASLMGRGIVEPVDEMDAEPWHEDLLDYLAADLQDHGYDLKRTLELIATSRAYQLPAVRDAKADAPDYEFRGPLVKRMSAEQFVDALSQVTGRWLPVTPLMRRTDGRGQGGQMQAVTRAVHGAVETNVALNTAWIWDDAKAATAGVNGGDRFFRRTFTLDAVPQRVFAVIAADNDFTLHVNGKQAGTGKDWSSPLAVDVTDQLKAGENVIAIEAGNWPIGRRGRDAPEPNPAGMIFFAAAFNGDEQVWSLGTDAKWVTAAKRGKGWMAPMFDDSGWTAAAELGGPDMAPWGLAAALSRTLSSASAPAPQEVRASLAMDDALMTALGRPGREQVVTRRDSVATTLQALELTNGAVLDERLKAGAAEWAGRGFSTSSELVEQLYLAALGRRPTAAEFAAAATIVGTPDNVPGITDLLWALMMSPEFQLID